MAKTKVKVKKKAENKSLAEDEILASALVPEDEQPYKLPNNWEWVRGKDCLLPMTTKKPSGDYFNYIDIDSINNVNQTVNPQKKIPVSQAPSRASREIKEGDTLFSMVRPYLKNIAYINTELKNCIASTGFFICRPKIYLNNKYLYFFMISGYTVDSLNAFMKGDNSPSIKQENIYNFAFPIPPLKEQEQIVERIESLFKKLDRAKELAQNALDSFETRKAAILHKTFSGELTAKWRKENGIKLESWKEKTLENYAKMQYGFTESSTTEAVGPKFLRITDIQDESVNWDSVPFCKIDKSIKEKYVLHKGDIVIARTGATTGKSYLINDDVDAVFASYLVRIIINNWENLSPKYLSMFMLSQNYWLQITDFSQGIAQPGVNTLKLLQVMLPVPSLPEQQEIVRILDCLFEKEKRARELCGVIGKIDLMKKAILARAFRGELGTGEEGERVRVE
jgi:type I restriction enzyme S subunit